MIAILKNVCWFILITSAFVSVALLIWFMSGVAHAIYRDYKIDKPFRLRLKKFKKGVKVRVKRPNHKLYGAAGVLTEIDRKGYGVLDYEWAVHIDDLEQLKGEESKNLKEGTRIQVKNHSPILSGEIGRIKTLNKETAVIYYHWGYREAIVPLEMLSIIEEMKK